MRTHSRILLASTLFAMGAAHAAEIPAEFQIKRAEVYEFAAPPKVTRSGDRIEVAFEAKGRCDVTVAIEDAEGNVVRHLASGVLGNNAPAPFQKDSLAQKIVWDGKDDLGKYIDDKDSHTVRVSLGLKPQFERTLFWCPQKRVGISNRPLIAPAAEGVYVHEGEGVDILKLYDHDGNYVRTIYPFPADKLKEVKGLDWQAFPQDGASLPVKSGPKHHATFLTGGDSMLRSIGKYGAGGWALSVAGSRIALAGLKLTRIATDGTSGGLDLIGPNCGIKYVERGTAESCVQPRSVALSPDGKWVYATGYHRDGYWYPCVLKAPYDGAAGSEPQIFAGKAQFLGSQASKDPNDFHAPTSVACDSAGRVYVSDFMNDRVQVFTPDGKLFKSLKTAKPAIVQVAQKSQEIYVFSFFQLDRHIPNEFRIKAQFTRYGKIEDPKKISEIPLPLNGYSEKPGLRWDGFHYQMAVDGYTEPPTIWIVPGKPGTTEQLEILRGHGGDEQMARASQVKLLVEKGGKFEVKRDFGDEIAKSVVRVKPQVHTKQRLYVNPVDRKLYVWEGDSGVNKSCKQLVKIDPDTGEIGLTNLPFTAEDLVFSRDGMIYLRTDAEVARYDFRTWREVPFDYGEERPKIGFDGSIKTAQAVSALILPSRDRPAWFHMGGMSLNAKGHLAVACFNTVRKEDRREFAIDGSLASKFATAGGRKYTPPVFPGRVPWGEVHVWDRHGQLVHEDAVPGLTVTDGIEIDDEDNLYLLASSTRLLDGKPYFQPWTETWFKVAPKANKVVSNSDRATVALGKDGQPGGPATMAGMGTEWVEGLQWAYGGVGFNGFKGGGCVCWNARCALDYFARTFAPEVDHFSVAVLDSNGNVITRVGRYGTIDEGQPLVAEGGPKNPKSIGGDEVPIYHAPYVGTHTDKRLFISDGGNRRILSVKLGYHAQERVPLKSVPEATEK